MNSKFSLTIPFEEFNQNEILHNTVAYQSDILNAYMKNMNDHHSSSHTNFDKFQVHIRVCISGLTIINTKKR
jgi:hypothetical protein